VEESTEKKASSRPSLRENPDRSIYVNTSINRETYNRIFPEVIDLQNRSDQSICLYIDSYGGSVYYSEKLRELLTRPDQNGRSCIVIGIVPSLAASAAADLAILSDYAIMYPKAIIHCHGTRIGEDSLTEDNIKLREHELKLTNREHAVKLAVRVCERLIQRISKSIPKESGYDLNKVLEDYYKSHDSDFSKNTSEFIANVLKMWNGKRAVYSEVSKILDTTGSYKEYVKNTIDILDDDHDKVSALEWIKESIEGYELWSSTIEDYTINSITDQVGALIISSEEFDEAKKIKDSAKQKEYIRKKSAPYITLLWVYAFHFSDCLHRGENRFSSSEAYMLGLIDEVCGMSDLYPCYRQVQEKHN